MLINKNYYVDRKVGCACSMNIDSLKKIDPLKKVGVNFSSVSRMCKPGVSNYLVVLVNIKSYLLKYVECSKSYLLYFFNLKTC